MCQCRQQQCAYFAVLTISCPLVKTFHSHKVCCRTNTIAYITNHTNHTTEPYIQYNPSISIIGWDPTITHIHPRTIEIYGSLWLRCVGGGGGGGVESKTSCGDHLSIVEWLADWWHVSSYCGTLLLLLSQFSFIPPPLPQVVLHLKKGES